MTNVHPFDDIERRLSRLENMMGSAGEMMVQTSSQTRQNTAELEAARELLLQTAALTQQNTSDFEDIRELLVQSSSLTQQNSSAIDTIRAVLAEAAAVSQQTIRIVEANRQDIQALTRRVDSLAAASERHDRILDFLLRREAGDLDPE
jgi:methyl-accepting chemotaxis protein